MAFNITESVQVFSTVSDSSILGFNNLVAFLIIGITIVLITRESTEMKKLLAPVSLAWYVVGLSFHWAFLVVFVLFSMITSFGTAQLGNIIRSPMKIREFQEELFEKSVKRAKTRAKLDDQLMKLARQGDETAHKILEKNYGPKKGLKRFGFNKDDLTGKK